MSSRGNGLKLALLAAPLAAGLFSLYAFGEPAGRAARAASAALSYPEHLHGAWRIRERRGIEYHPVAARILEDFAAALSAWSAPLGIVRPSRVDVYLLDTREDLERFGFDPRRLEGEGLAEPAAGVIALVAEGRTHHLEQDARSLRHWMTRLLLSPALERAGAGSWAIVGLASCFETATPGAPETGVRATDLAPVPLATLLSASPADFRGASSARFAESARLLAAFLLERRQGGLLAWLRGDAAGAPDRFASCFGDLRTLEDQWKEWLRRPPK